MDAKEARDLLILESAGATIAKRIAELPWDVPVGFEIDKRIVDKMKEKAHGKSKDDRSV